ncbi:TPA: hypothetical protein ACH3X2_011511 [Trebouxia sp. C0005]|nr:MAG: hypothetical protein FRX49_00478 [Trebouxia sp. A1-2]
MAGFSPSSETFRVLRPGPVTKEVPCGSDNLLEYYGLSGIYSKFKARGPDAFLKGLPSELDFRRGHESMELATLGSLNPLGVDITPLTPYQLMPFKLQPKVLSPSLLSEDELGQAVNLDALRVKTKPETLSQAQPSGSKLKKDKKDKDKKQKREKKDRGSKRKASEEPSDGTTTVTGMPSTGASSGAVRLRIKQPKLG